MSKCNAILRKKTPFELLWLYFMVIVILKFIYTYFLSLMNRFLSPIFNQNFNILYLKVKPQGEIYIDRKINWTECASSPAKKGSKKGTTWCMDMYTRPTWGEQEWETVPCSLSLTKKRWICWEVKLYNKGYFNSKTSHFRPVHTAKGDHIY
jgi:hypothetical protein